MSLRSALAAALGLLLVLPAAVRTASAQTTSQVETAFPSLSFTSPIELTHAGDGSGLLYVAEKAGRIRSFENVRTTTASTTVLDITGIVQNSGEQGFLGFAFHPNYATNGYVYVHYSGRTNGRTVLARYTRSATNPAVLDPASAQILLEVAQPFSNHNGGKLAFGPDGYLYLSLGDGGSGGDPGNRAQNRTVFLGKLLRLDVDNPSGGLNYGIPPTNPFAGNTLGYRQEIYAYGLRNMFKFSFDRQTGTLWGADVGQDAWEEVDLITNGGNFGWRLMEGMHCFNPSTGCVQTGLTLPVYEYSHSEGCSITGGPVYRGSRNPDLTGTYLFSDYCTATVWGLSYNGTTATRRTVVQAGDNVIALGEDAQGEVYVLRESTGAASIQRFVATAVAGEAGAPAAAAALRVAGANPFTDRALVEVTAAVAGPVRVTVADVLGREVAVLFDGPVAAGERRSLAVDGAPLAPGVYLVRMDAADGSAPPSASSVPAETAMTAPRAAAVALASVALLALASVLGTPHAAATYPSGAPAGFAGDLSDVGTGVRTCAAEGCHDSYDLNSGTGSVTVSVPAVVAPGQTVPVTVTVNNTTAPAEGAVVRQGFQAVARDAAGNFVGTTTITDATATRLAGDGAAPYVTHRTAGTTRTSWTFNWTAPDAPATVTFYASGNAANGGDLPDSTGTPTGNNASGDYIYTTAQTVDVGLTAADGGPDAAGALALSAPHPNPVRAGTAVVRLTLAAPQVVRVRVVDGRGRTVRRVLDGSRPAGESVVTVRTAGLAPGLYFVVAETASGRAVQPVSVVR